MNIPGFTAEASLGGIKDSYALALRHAETTGAVVPQYHCECFLSPWGPVCECFPVVE